MSRNNGTMPYEDTICYKVTQCVNQMEQAVRTGSFDVAKVTETLVKIRSDAIKMENALKANKVLRLKHKIDPEYREMMKETNTPPGINNMPVGDYKVKDSPKFELILKDEKGKVLYHNKLFAFIMCAVERIDDIDTAGMIDGQTQTFAAGNDLAVWYAFDQLKQKFAAKFTDLMLRMANSVRVGKFANRAERRKLLRAANGKRPK